MELSFLIFPFPFSGTGTGNIKFRSEFRDEKFVPENMFSDFGKLEKFLSLLSPPLSLSHTHTHTFSISLSLYLSVCLSIFLSFVRKSVHLSVFLSFFFSSRISLLKQKLVIFLVPEIRAKNGNFF
jgi:hypothetical protein